jgi:xylulokinase
LEARGVYERQQQAFERAFDALIPVLELLNP